MWPCSVGGFGRVWFGLPFSREELRGPGELQVFPISERGFCLKGLGFMWCFLIFGEVYYVRGSIHVDLTS